MSDAPLFVRPAKPEDIPHLLALAREAGTGMTTVPQTEEGFAERIDASTKAFCGTGQAQSSDIFFFALILGDTLVGMASIFPNLGGDRPFYSYRLTHIAAQVPELNLRAGCDVLHLVNDYHGYDELGSLLVSDKARGRGAGRLLSLCRLVCMGMRPERFSGKVVAEIRGSIDQDGNSPFWDNVAAKFFNLSFDEADRLSAHDFRFISHLMPKYPIYVSLLPKEAQEAIGKPHHMSRLAMGLLEAEGFRYTRCVDIFDGGPAVEAELRDLRTVRQMERRALTVSDSIEHITSPEAFIVAKDDMAGFAATLGQGHRSGNTVVLAPASAAAIGLSNGANVFATPLKG